MFFDGQLQGVFFQALCREWEKRGGGHESKEIPHRGLSRQLSSAITLVGRKNLPARMLRFTGYFDFVPLKHRQQARNLLRNGIPYHEL